MSIKTRKQTTTSQFDKGRLHERAATVLALENMLRAYTIKGGDGPASDQLMKGLVMVRNLIASNMTGPLPGWRTPPKCTTQLEE